MQIIAFLQVADIPRAGRVDFASMTDQTVMELLVSDIHNLSSLQNTLGEFRDIVSWEGVDIVGLTSSYVVGRLYCTRSSAHTYHTLYLS